MSIESLTYADLAGRLPRIPFAHRFNEHFLRQLRGETARIKASMGL